MESDSSSESSTDQPTTPVETFNYNQCIAAIRGEAVPSSLESSTTRASIIRGIRRHYNFATSPAVTELCNSRYPD